MSKYAPHRRTDNNPRATSSTVCQKCLGTGHFIYECKSTRPYVSRPSRTQQLEKPKLLAKLQAEGKPSVEVPEEFITKKGTANKILEGKEKERSKDDKSAEGSKRRRGSVSTSSSSSGSDSGSQSGSSSDSDSSSSSSSSTSSRDHKRRKTRRRTASPAPSDNDRAGPSSSRRRQSSSPDR